MHTVFLAEKLLLEAGKRNKEVVKKRGYITKPLA